MLTFSDTGWEYAEVNGSKHFPNFARSYVLRKLYFDVQDLRFSHWRLCIILFWDTTQPTFRRNMTPPASGPKNKPRTLRSFHLFSIVAACIGCCALIVLMLLPSAVVFAFACSHWREVTRWATGSSVPWWGRKVYLSLNLLCNTADSLPGGEGARLYSR
jgi:hypothetical protein